LYTTPTFTVILLFVFLIRPPPRSTLFPYTTLFRSTLPADFTKLEANKQIIENFNTYGRDPDGAFTIPAYAAVQILTQSIEAVGEDRKSTRLNSSHVKISYAVFCLKKKTKTETCINK